VLMTIARLMRPEILQPVTNFVRKSHCGVRKDMVDLERVASTGTWRTAHSWGW
jgi:hypothetical protein